MRSIPSKASATPWLSAVITPVESDQVPALARFFSALADPTRLKLLTAINAAGRLGASECVKASGLSQGRTSVHLSCLAACGLIGVERAGRRKYYRIASPIVPELLRLSLAIVNDNNITIAQCHTAQPTNIH